MKLTIKLLLALCVAGFAGNAFAQNSNTATGTSNATVLRPIHILLNASAMNFGKIVSTVAGGTVTRPGNGTEVYTSDAGSDPGVGNYGSRNDLTATVTGTASSLINYSASAVSGLPVGFSLALLNAAGSGVLNGSGFYTFTMGGTLTIPGGASPQTVIGTWTETAGYN